MEPFLRGHQAPSVAQKMPTCLSHQSTQKINHPLPTHTVAMLWESCSSQSPSQGSGGSCWDLPGLLGFSRAVAGCSESRWASHRGYPCSQPFSLLSSSKAGERTSPPGTQPLFSGGDGALGLKFPSGAGEVTGPFVFRARPQCVQEASAMPLSAQSLLRSSSPMGQVGF